MPETSVSGFGSNPGPRRPVAASCRILSSNVRGLSGNLSDLAVASSQYDILLRVNQQGILYKLNSVGIGDSVLSVLTQFLI